MVDTYLQKSTITTTSNFFGVGGTTVQLDLDPGLTSVEMSQENKIIIIERPRSRATQSLYAPVVWAIDLKRIKRTFSIKGYFMDGDGSNITGTNPALTNTALNCAKVLSAMQEEGGTLTFYYDGSSFTCIINSITITDREPDKAAGRAGEAKYEYAVSLTKADLR